MRRGWLAVEVMAWTVFAGLLIFIWASMLGDYHRITYDTPGSLGLLVCVFVAGYANKRRGGRSGLY
jgi:hypothetical protein